MAIDDKVGFFIDTDYYVGIIKNINNDKAEILTYMGLIVNVPLIECTKNG